jgi:hypothetical protein
MQSVHCVACHRLCKTTAALILEYNAALNALAATPRSDSAYAERWIGLSAASERLYKAQRLEHLHRDSHHTH